MYFDCYILLQAISQVLVTVLIRPKQLLYNIFVHLNKNTIFENIYFYFTITNITAHLVQKTFQNTSEKSLLSIKYLYGGHSLNIFNLVDFLIFFLVIHEKGFRVNFQIFSINGSRERFFAPELLKI